jgi:hypothetical protein
MIIRENKHGYSSHRKYIHGTGFIDTLKSIGTYVVQNRDLLAKPLLGAVGNLAAAGLTEGGKALLTRILANKKKSAVPMALDAKSQAILQSIINDPVPVTNVIGSGTCGATGSGIKKF